MTLTVPPSRSHGEWTEGHRCRSDDLCAEHSELARELREFDAVAEEVGIVPLETLRKDVDRVYGLLTQRLIPHIRAEYEFRTRLAAHDHIHVAPDEDHGLIRDLARQLSRLRTEIRKGESADAPRQVRRVLFELHALTQLHFADELVDGRGSGGR